MKYTVHALYNIRRDAMITGWMPGDPLFKPKTKDGRSPMIVEALSPAAAADQLYRAMNHVDGSEVEIVGLDRSMSVGDVAVINDGTTETRLAVDRVGWRDTRTDH